MSVKQLKGCQDVPNSIWDETQMFPEEMPVDKQLSKKYAVSQGTLIGRIGLIAVLTSFPIATAAAILKCKPADGSDAF